MRKNVYTRYEIITAVAEDPLTCCNLLKKKLDTFIQNGFSKDSSELPFNLADEKRIAGIGGVTITPYSPLDPRGSVIAIQPVVVEFIFYLDS
jgi:hypothetical protein